MMSKKIPKVGDKFHRFIDLEKLEEGIDTEARTVQLAFASEEPYERWWGIEVIDVNRLDLTRLNNSAALLYNHDPDALIGVVTRAWTDDDKIARASVRFSESDLGQEKFSQVMEEVLTKVSFGYEITAMEEINMVAKVGDEDKKAYRVTASPFEISMVSIPADDVGAGVGKSIDKDIVHGSAVVESKDKLKALEVSVMEKEKTVENEVENTPTIDTKELERAAFEKGQLARAAYEKEVREICGLVGMNEKADVFISENVDVKHVREALIEAKAAQDTQEVSVVRIEAGEDLKVKRDEERVNQLAHLINPALKRSDVFGSIRGPQGLLKNIMKESNVDVSEMTADDLTDSLLSRDHSTSDFSIILKDAANKALLESFDAQLAVQNWRVMCREREVADYKEINVARLGESPDLVEKLEGSEYTSGTVSETGEAYRVKDYGRMVSFTDRALRNDDLGAFSRGLLQFGSSAARKESDIFYDQFQNGTVDGSTMYSVARNTLQATTSLDIPGLSTLRQALMTQTGLDSSAALNLMGSYLVVPPSLYTEAQQLMNGQYVPTQVGQANVFLGTMQVVTDSRLPDGAWYMTADLSQIDLFEIAYLSGRRVPMLENRINFSTDSLDAKIKHSFAIKAIDYRGLQKATI
ncbi:MAG: hypothetical protein GY718_04490 [Lentisphaerae bacterium]|nr:hypothetical protein [Lentisphaerota bacterium]MCP4140707.1 hypothetical protein [Chloroflexota bacterium]